MATSLSAQKGSFFGSSRFTPAKQHNVTKRASLQVVAGMKEVRDRIASIKNTQKITEAMKLVAAAKVRRAQDAVVNGRPFSEALVKVLYGVNQRVRLEDIDSPLCELRPVKTVLLVVLTGDRGLCGGYNNFILKKTEARWRELNSLGVKVKIVAIGKKGVQYFQRRPKFDVTKSFAMGSAPTTKEAQAAADEIFASFVSQECDKVELIYTKFVSLINSVPVVQTLLPLTPSGKLCDIDGNCVDAMDDEIFKLTSKGGKLAVEREKVAMDPESLDSSLIFDQDPAQILDALLPLYMNSCLLRSFQESLASELASRMTAMSNAVDNANELRKVMTLQYNKARQSKITQELNEIMSGAASSG